MVLDLVSLDPSSHVQFPTGVSVYPLEVGRGHGIYLEKRSSYDEVVDEEYRCA